MASKKYTLIAGLLLAATTSGFSQLAGVVDYKDSSKVPAKRMAQQNEWRNNSTTQSFPARPRDMWQIGIYGGGFAIDGDVAPISPLPGFDIGLQIRKSLGYVFSVRGQLGYGVTKGLDTRPSASYLNNSVYRDYQRADRVYFANYRTQMITPSVDVIASLNNIMFHKKSNKINFYVLGGYSTAIFKAEINAKGANNEIYDFSSVNYLTATKKEIRSAVKDIIDDTYETAGKIKPRRQNFDNSESKWQARHSWDVGAGAEVRVSPRVSIGAEIKYLMTTDDFLDGYAYQYNGTLTPNNDNIVFGNLSINYNIGSSAKRVAPLWWLNPLGYVYSELSNPTIMKFPKPVLDDTDNDGVTDQFDIEPNTPAGCPVDTKGKSRDTDGDGVPDCRDQELITPTSCQPVNADGVGTCPDPACCKNIVPQATCNIGSLPSVQFTSGVKVNAAGSAILDAAAAQIKANPLCKIAVIGHGGASKREQQLSWDRVESVITYLVEKQGIGRDRFVFKYGEEGDASTVDLQVSEGEDGPNMVPAPHPQYRKIK